MIILERRFLTIPTYKRYDDDFVDKIYDNINKFNNASDLAKFLNVDVSGLTYF